jgi:hypothetical protein
MNWTLILSLVFFLGVEDIIKSTEDNIDTKDNQGLLSQNAYLCYDPSTLKIFVSRSQVC